MTQDLRELGAVRAGHARVLSGTLVTLGQGIVEIAATGPRTELGKIGKALEQTKAEPTMLQTETRRIVRLLAITGLGACCVVVVAFAQGRPVRERDLSIAPLQGFSILAVRLGGFLLARRDHSDDAARALTFVDPVS